MRFEESTTVCLGFGPVVWVDHGGELGLAEKMRYPALPTFVDHDKSLKALVYDSVAADRCRCGSDD